jgi:hypothetical protein
MEEILQSYLVSLGFQVNQDQLNKFRSSVADTSSKVQELTQGLEKAVAGVLTGVATIGVAFATLADKVAQSDLGFQLFALRMYMSVDAAKKLKIATDALGYSLDDIAWNPELRQRYMALVGEQNVLGRGLGPDFEAQMKKLRDVRFAFTELGVAVQYGVQKMVAALAQGLAPELSEIMTRVQGWTTWFETHMDEIGRLTKEYLVPILKDAYAILADLVAMAKQAWGDFLDLVGLLSGDKKLQQGNLLERTLELAKQVSHEIRIITDGVKWLMDKLQAAGEFLGVFQKHDAAATGTATDRADEGRKAAVRISAATGIPASVLFAQMAHETNSFRDYKAGQNFRNFSGMKNTSGNYQAFGSWTNYADAYTGWLQRHHMSGSNVSSVEDLAAQLKNQHYYGDTEANYRAGLERHAGDYGSVTVGSINVHVGGLADGVTADQIGERVARRLKDEQGKLVQRNLGDLAGPYH